MSDVHFLNSLMIHQVETKEITTVTMFGYLIFISIDFYDLSLILASIEKIYQTLKTVLEQFSKHLELRQKYFAARRIFALFSVFELLLIDNAFL